MLFYAEIDGQCCQFGNLWKNFVNKDLYGRGTVKTVKPIKQSKKISNDQELIQSDPISSPQNQKGNN